mmetsp:Transcript_28848/g.71960  ORF Transcript_28848/g.71960 Transcript_28848/m.71960 type:complete len:222 (-) Transcript_28848:905-1570(-)
MLHPVEFLLVVAALTIQTDGRRGQFALEFCDQVMVGRVGLLKALNTTHQLAMATLEALIVFFKRFVFDQALLIGALRHTKLVAGLVAFSGECEVLLLGLLQLLRQTLQLCVGLALQLLLCVAGILSFVTQRIPLHLQLVQLGFVSILHLLDIHVAFALVLIELPLEGSVSGLLLRQPALERLLRPLLGLSQVYTSSLLFLEALAHVVCLLDPLVLHVTQPL